MQAGLGSVQKRLHGAYSGKYGILTPTQIEQNFYFVQLYGRQKIEAAVSPLKALIQKSKLCFLYIKFPLRSQFKICLHLIESGQQDNL